MWLHAANVMYCTDASQHGTCAPWNPVPRPPSDAAGTSKQHTLAGSVQVAGVCRPCAPRACTHHCFRFLDGVVPKVRAPSSWSRVIRSAWKISFLRRAENTEGTEGVDVGSTLPGWALVGRQLTVTGRGGKGSRRHVNPQLPALPSRFLVIHPTCARISERSLIHARANTKLWLESHPAGTCT